MHKDRWPPVYDADELVAEIQALTGRPDFESLFYEWRRQDSTRDVTDVCQGDVVTLSSEVPVIADDGQPGTIANDSGTWLVLGNTCDFERDLTDCRWTQLAPVVDLGGPDLEPTLRSALRRYTQFRRFYVPPWSNAVEARWHVAELPLTVAVDKRAFPSAIRVQARMSFRAWILMNACLVRFLARDDGRYAT